MIFCTVEKGPLARARRMLCEGMCGGIFFVESEEEMMKTRSCLKIESLNYFVKLFKVQSNPTPLNCDLGCKKIHSIYYLNL
jgi:hypothetical protein